MPKLIVAGVTVSRPAVAPVPAKGMMSDGVEGLVASMLPLKAPADDGANVTLKVKLCPAAKINGSVTPVTENPVPDILPIDTV